MGEGDPVWKNFDVVGDGEKLSGGVLGSKELLYNDQIRDGEYNE